ncbi:metallophosphoesterase [Campylobacter estrildidarum]|uniref:Metallophosphoesterase n=1 Tax=Campylobacter estrildidarum TaxID=2510189 RepID=A0A4V6DW69_9BACT|nr:metallophosphoesterase [Campylobacter estrildidarum]TKX30942.1 metallophosphoesterase [Campylobacter estrildidarum]
MMYLFFCFIVLIILGSLNLYIYKRLIKKFLLFKYFHKLFAFVLAILFLVQIIFLILRRNQYEYLNDSLYEILAMLYAPTYCLFFVTLILDFIRLVLALLGRIDRKYNIFLRLLFETGVIAISAFLTYASVNSALKIPEIKTLNLQIANLKKDLKIAVLTDIHLGKNLHENFLDQIINKVNLEKPDMVFIIGDLIDVNPEHLKSYISKINDLNSTYGTFYVVGNHEYYHGINKVLNLLKTYTKMKILLNQNEDLGFVNIAGLSDLAGIGKGLYAPNLERIKADLNTSKPSILLTHQPKAALLYNLKDFDLILSGHTHGGQIFPFMLLVKLQQGFVYGLYNLNQKTKLYVSSGAGFWGPSLRVFAPSEIVILNLKGK